MRIIAILLGIISTMPILGIRINGKLISLFYILFGIFNIWLVVEFFTKRETIKLNKESKRLLIWFMICIFSCLCGIIYFGTESMWGKNIFKYIINIIIYSFTLILLSSYNNKRIIIFKYIKGFIIGILVNCIWGIMEGVLYYTFRFRLNDFMFGSIVRLVDREHISVVTTTGIRASGLNVDPAHLGGLIPLLILYSLISRKYFITVIGTIALIFTQSTTGLVVTLILIILNSKLLYKINKTKLRINKKRGILFIITIVTCFSVISVEKFRTQVLNSTQSFITRIEGKASESSLSKREIYHKYILNAMEHNGPIAIIGTGLGTSGYPYINNEYISKKMPSKEEFAYDVESTYLSYILDIGILGTIMYIYIIFMLFNKYKNSLNSNENIILFASILAIGFSGLFYHYIFTAYQIIIIIIASIWNKNDIRSILK